MNHLPAKTAKKHSGYCLLHGDFHPMGPECWDTIVEFYFKQGELDHKLSDVKIKEKYDAEVEQKMLYDLSVEISSGMWG